MGRHSDVQTTRVWVIGQGKTDVRRDAGVPATWRADATPFSSAMRWLKEKGNGNLKPTVRFESTNVISTTATITTADQSENRPELGLRKMSVDWVREQMHHQQRPDGASGNGHEHVSVHRNPVQWRDSAVPHTSRCRRIRQMSARWLEFNPPSPVRLSHRSALSPSWCPPARACLRTQRPDPAGS